MYGLRKNRLLTVLCFVYASCSSNDALTSDLFLLDIGAATFSKVETTDGPAGL